jgi:hypothetical protein
VTQKIMRPITGFERPLLQYVFVALAAVLIGTSVWGAVSVRRAAGEIERLRADDLNGRVERQQLERRAAREQSARESLSLQLARVQAGSAAGSNPPTLTLLPLTTRGAAPPPPTVMPPGPAQIIALRLVLPRGRSSRAATYQISVRSWTGGQTIWLRSGLPSSKADGREIVQANITGDVFAPGAYEVLLTGRGDGAQQDVASYEVSVGR